MIAVYPGSFNPVTKAHQKIAEIALEYADKLIFVPVNDKYQKDSLNINGEHRLNMLKLLENDKIIVSDIEVRDVEQNKTIETMFNLYDIYKDNMMLVIGGDNLESFHNWYMPDAILENFKLLVISRNNDVDEIISDDPLLNLYKDKIITVSLKLDISSNKVRDLLSKGKDVSELVDSKVIDYIKKEKLY